MKKGSERHLRIGNLIWCRICQQYKDIEEFYLDKLRPSGRVSECKSCRGAYQKEYLRNYYLAHREELLPGHRISARKSLLKKSLS